MLELGHMNTLVTKLFLSTLVLGFMASCSLPAKDSNDSSTQKERIDCISLEGSAARKSQLETGIRGQVKFMGESENLSSITSKMSAYNIPALSLAVIHQGEIEWTDIYQNANLAEEELNCTSIFQAASLSKPVTFLAAMRMHAAGEIDLDEDIATYLKDYALPPGQQTADNPVTFRNIFAHTSGITAGGYEGYGRDLGLPSDLDILRGSAGVNSPAIEVITSPNEALAYSGGAYTLAEVAIQDIYEAEFSNVMKEWILEPVGMKHSEFTQPLPASQSDRVAKGYTQTGELVDGGWRNHPEQAAAGLWSNATDMALFLIEMYKAYHGKSSIFTQADIQSIIKQERDGQAYGFLLSRSGGDIAITHYGGNVGYRTGMTISLTSGNGLVYLINSDNGGALGNELLLSASQVYSWEHFKQTNASREQVSAEELEQLSGDYKWNNQVDLSIRYDESNELIALIFPNGDEYKLTPITGDELNFIHLNTGVEVAFLEKDDFKSFTLYGQTAVKI